MWMVTFTLIDLMFSCHRANFIMSDKRLLFICLELAGRSLMCSTEPFSNLIEPIRSQLAVDITLLVGRQCLP